MSQAPPAAGVDPRKPRVAARPAPPPGSLGRLGVALAVVGAVGSHAGPAIAVRFAKQELSVPGSILWFSSGDLDGDGRTDLVFSYRRGAGPRAQKFMAIFFRGDDGYAVRPEVAMLAPARAAVFDVGDALGDGADELLYLASDGVYAQSLAGRKPAAPVRVVGVSSLIAAPEEDDLAAWDFVRAFGPNGPPLMLVPTPGPLKIYRREGDAWRGWVQVAIDQESAYDAELSTFRRDRRGGSSGRPYAFRATTVIPVLDFIDQTGDGRVDLVTEYEDRIRVYPQLEDGSLAPRPAHAVWFGVRTPRELEARDSGVSSQVLDLDADGIADACITKISGGVTTLATETSLFRGVKGGGFESSPAQTFRDEGFAALVQFMDVDGDGFLEMIQPHSEVSVVAISQMMLSKELTLDVRIRRRSPERPAFFEKAEIQTLETVFGLDLTVGATLHGTFPIFGHDFDGDGRKDVVLSQGALKMALHRGIREDGELFEDEGRIALSAPGTSATLSVFPTTRRAGRPDLVLYYVDRPDLAGKVFVFRAID